MMERAIELESGSAQEVQENDVVVQLRENCKEWVMNNDDPEVEVENLNVIQENVEANDEDENIMETDEEAQNVVLETKNQKIEVKSTP